MVTITTGEGKFFTNGSIYIRGTIYLPAQADAEAWVEVDSVTTETYLTPEEAAVLLFGSVDNIRDSDAQSAQKTLDTIQALGGLKTEIVQSDKLGYDWKNVCVGDVLVRQEYVEQEVKTGTEENPIVYTDGVPLINNAYYIKDRKKYVWMEEWVEWQEAAK
jgi:hypothetical protein